MNLWLHSCTAVHDFWSVLYSPVSLTRPQNQAGKFFHCKNCKSGQSLSCNETTSTWSLSKGKYISNNNGCLIREKNASSPPTALQVANLQNFTTNKTVCKFQFCIRVVDVGLHQQLQISFGHQISQGLGQPIVWFPDTRMLHAVIISQSWYYEEVTSLTNWSWWDLNLSLMFRMLML